MQPFKLQGMTVDEKLNHAALVLDRLNNRQELSSAVVVFPPNIYSGFKETVGEDGIIFKCMFPVRGKLSKLCVMIEDVKENTEVIFSLKKLGVHTKAEQISYIIMKTNFMFELITVDVKPGDYLICSTKMPEKITNIYVAILYNIDSIIGTPKVIKLGENS